MRPNWADHTGRAHQLVGHAARICAAGDSADERPRLRHVFGGGIRERYFFMPFFAWAFLTAFFA
jgi:hypothetical protein